MTRPALLGMAVAACILSFAGHALADGENMNLHNKTGQTVAVFLFNDTNVHLSETGGVSQGTLANGASVVVHTTSCAFSILVINRTVGWHFEFHDCKSTDLTVTTTSANKFVPHPG